MLLPVMLEVSSVLVVVVVAVRVILVHVDEIGAHTGHGRSVALRLLWRMAGSGVAQGLAIPAPRRSGLVVGVQC